MIKIYFLSDKKQNQILVDEIDSFVSANVSDTENIIEILGNLQPFLQKPIIKNKLLDFFKSDKDFQSNTIRLILDSLPKVDLEKIMI